MSTDKDLNRPERIGVTPQFPYVVEEENIPVHRMIVIEHQDRWMDLEDRTLFLVANGDFELRNDNNIREARVQLKHSFAGDDEADTPFIGLFELKSPELVSIWGGTFTFSAWLTEARFYPENLDPEEGEQTWEHFNPFTGVTKTPVAAGDETNGYYNDNGFPFQPPKVHFSGKKISLPMQVRIIIYTDLHEPEKYIENTLHSIEAAREGKAEAYRKEQEARRERRALWAAEAEKEGN